MTVCRHPVTSFTRTPTLLYIHTGQEVQGESTEVAAILRTLGTSNGKEVHLHIVCAHILLYFQFGSGLS